MSGNVIKMSPFLWRKEAPQGARYLHWCAACKSGHTYPVKGALKGHSWTFDGSIDKPSFEPSMLIFTPAQGLGNQHVPQATVCHYYLRNGRIEYQQDCPHTYAGKTVPLEPIPEDYGF